MEIGCLYQQNIKAWWKYNETIIFFHRKNRIISGKVSDETLYRETFLISNTFSHKHLLNTRNYRLAENSTKNTRQCVFFGWEMLMFMRIFWHANKVHFRSESTVCTFRSHIVTQKVLILFRAFACIFLQHIRGMRHRLIGFLAKSFRLSGYLFLSFKNGTLKLQWLNNAICFCVVSQFWIVVVHLDIFDELFHNSYCRRLPPLTAWSTPLITMDKTRAHRDILRPYSKIKLIKPSLYNSLDKYPPFWRYIFIYLYANKNTYMILRIFT